MNTRLARTTGIAGLLYVALVVANIVGHHGWAATER
jgi:hypothetical protein